MDRQNLGMGRGGRGGLSGVRWSIYRLRDDLDGVDIVLIFRNVSFCYKHVNEKSSFRMRTDSLYILTSIPAELTISMKTA